MTREEMYSLKEGNVVYCSQEGWYHGFYFGEKLTRRIDKLDDSYGLCFVGDHTAQYMMEEDISFTNPLTDKND